MLTLEHKTNTVELLPNAPIIEAARIMQAYNEAHGELIDWHEFAYYLDELMRKDLLVISKPGGRTEYKLNE